MYNVFPHIHPFTLFGPLFPSYSSLPPPQIANILLTCVFLKLDSTYEENIALVFLSLRVLLNMMISIFLQVFFKAE
jgi:hypothetical protein